MHHKIDYVPNAENLLLRNVNDESTRSDELNLGFYGVPYPLQPKDTIEESTAALPPKQLFTVVDNSLNPIETALNKSGVYRKVNANDFTFKNKEKFNVFYSTTERHGNIVRLPEFKNRYISLDDVRADAGTEKDARDTSETGNYCNDILNVVAYDYLKLTNRQNVVIDRQRNEIIYRDPKVKKKTIFRIISPESLGLKVSRSGSNILPFNTHRKKVGRPRKEDKPIVKPTNETPKVYEKPKPEFRTRSGRLVKSSISAVDDQQKNEFISFKDVIQDVKDADFKSVRQRTKPAEKKDSGNREGETAKKKTDYSCPKCHKVFLGRRLQKHFLAHPDHRPQPSTASMSLYKFLVHKLKESSDSEDQRTEFFLNEISDFVQQLQDRSSRLVRNTSGSNLVNQRCSKVLGIPEGQYSLDLHALDSTPDPVLHFELLAPPPPRMDYNLSMSLDDTLITDTKLNLSDNIIQSEESLLRTVDDLVKEGIKTIGVGDAIHYEHVNDNAVEAGSIQSAPILDLSLDLFHFNSN